MKSALQVPRNIAGFRHFRDSQGVTATMGIMMALVLCSFPATFIYLSWVDPSPRSATQQILTFLFSACSVYFAVLIGSGAWPSLQRSNDITRVLKQNLPALIVSQQGVWDYSSSYIFGFVPWEEIEAVMLDNHYSPGANKQWSGIAFVARNKEVLLSRKSVLARFWLNREATIADRRQIFIPQEWLDMSVGDLINQIEEFRQKTQS